MICKQEINDVHILKLHLNYTSRNYTFTLKVEDTQFRTEYLNIGIRLPIDIDMLPNKISQRTFRLSEICVEKGFIWMLQV